MKKWLSLFLAAMFLVGCTDEKEKVAEEVKGKEEKQIVKTPEQYMEEAQNTPLYKKIVENTQEHHVNVVDFEGDSIPEIIITTKNEDVKQATLVILKQEQNDWKETLRETFESNLYIELKVGALSYENSTKQALTIEMIEALANTMGSTVKIYDLNEEKQTIELTYDLMIGKNTMIKSAKETYTYEIEENKDFEQYTFKDGVLFAPSGKRVDAIINEKLAQLTGTTINNYGVVEQDGYSTAKEKITEPIIEESYYLGGLCAFYNDFFICNSGIDGDEQISTVAITPKKSVTVEEIEKALAIPFTIEEYEDYMEGGIAYSTELQLEDGTYNFNFSDGSDQAILKEVYYSPVNHEFE